MSGSIALSAIAALRTGSGLVTAAVPDRCLETVAAFHPGVMTLPLANDTKGCFRIDAAAGLSSLVKKFDAIGCGPGMTAQPGAIQIVERLLQETVPRVLDADAINCLAQIGWPQAGARSPFVLTPHPGEFQRISGVVASDRMAQINAAKGLADRTGIVIVLKGGPTVVVGSTETTNGQNQWTNTTGNAGMATAGSGDVLTGVITSLLGQGLSIWNAARLGVWIHGAAGDIAANQVGQTGMTSVEIAAALPEAAKAATEVAV